MRCESCGAPRTAHLFADDEEGDVWLCPRCAAEMRRDPDDYERDDGVTTFDLGTVTARDLLDDDCYDMEV